MIFCQYMLNDEVAKEPLSEFITVKSAAHILEVSQMTIYRYLKKKINPLPAVYMTNKSIRIPWAQFNIWLKKHMKRGEEN